MALEIVSDVISVIFKFIWEVIILSLFELLVKGAGFLICRLFSRKVKRDGGLVAVVGIAFWILIIFAIYQFNSASEVDKCLDSGGEFNYESRSCAF